MKCVGLTGGIGCGKTTLKHYLDGMGIPAIDTDLVARDLLLVGQPAYQAVVTRFGDECLTSDRSLNRTWLGNVIFKDVKQRHWLEGLLHPLIRSAWQGQVTSWKDEGRPMSVVVIPLLYETNAQSAFDAVFCMACSNQEQVRRLQHRGWSDEHLEQRLQSQWPLEKKMRHSDVVIWSEGPEETTHAQWDKAAARLLQSASKDCSQTVQ